MRSPGLWILITVAGIASGCGVKHIQGDRPVDATSTNYIDVEAKYRNAIAKLTSTSTPEDVASCLGSSYERLVASHISIPGPSMRRNGMRYVYCDGDITFWFKKSKSTTRVLHEVVLRKNLDEPVPDPSILEQDMTGEWVPTLNEYQYEVWRYE